MKRQKDDMQVNVAGFRRNIKNLAHNYSDAQIKVREATSNDPWGPSATIMAEVADLTYNVVAFSEIMQMIWKRLNDHGKNWRHVLKALILLEYLIKTGTEKVAQQCKENIFAIQTLKEFQHQEECNDQGIRVRDKAKQLVALLKDDERLKNERTKALKAKERFAQNASGFGSDGSIDGPTHRESPSWRSETDGASGIGGGRTSGGGAGAAPLEIEYVRPQTVGEEELQLQLAMAMSREEAEQEEAKRRSDDVRLQLALSQSENDFKQADTPPKKQESHLLDLLDISLGATTISSPADAWGMPRPMAAADPWANNQPASPVDPWQSGAASSSARPAGTGSVESWLSRTQSPSSGSSAESAWLQNGTTQPTIAANGHQTGIGAPSVDPWLTSKPIDWLNKPQPADPWQSPKNSTQVAPPLEARPADPWSLSNMGNRPSPIGAQMSPNSDLDDFDVITNRSKSTNNATSNNNNSSFLDDLDPLSSKKSSPPQQAAPTLNRTPQSFLGENSALVNLDNLIKPAVPNNGLSGTSAFGGSMAAAYNPFGETNTQPKPNLFQQQTQPVPSINQLKQSPFPVTMMSADPWAPVNTTTNQNATGNMGFASAHQMNASHTMNNNLINNNSTVAATNAPWLKPEAAASNPFLS